MKKYRLFQTFFLYLFFQTFSTSAASEYVLEASDDNTEVFNKTSNGYWFAQDHNKINNHYDFIITFADSSETQSATWQVNDFSNGDHGVYEVFVSIPKLSYSYDPDGNGNYMNNYLATENANYTIYDGSNLVETVIKSQKLSGSYGEWISLGSFTFDTQPMIKLSDKTSSSEKNSKKSIIFSAVKLELINQAVDGSCGDADNHTFTHDSTGYTSEYNQCNAGDISSNIFPEKGSTVSWSCDGKYGGKDDSCSASRDEAPSTKVNGLCGSANNYTFSYDEIQYTNEHNQCDVGSSTNTSFPNQGESVNWSCPGSNGGTNDNCTADRDSKPEIIVGVCGSAEKSYLYSETEFTGSFCSTGKLQGSPSFPEQGEEETWSCLGSNGGANDNCTAERGAKPIVKVDGECGTAAKAYPSNATEYDGTFCSEGELDGNPIFPSDWVCKGINEGADKSCKLTISNEGKSPVISLISHGSTYNANGNLNSYEGIDFGTSESKKYLRVQSEAIIKFNVSDPDNNLDYLDVNFDGSDRSPVRISLTEGTGEYSASNTYIKENYSVDADLDYWIKRDLEWSAVAYDTDGKESNMLSSSGFGIYDYDEYIAYLEAEKKRLLEEEAKHENLEKEIDLYVQELIKQQEAIDLTGVVDEFKSLVQNPFGSLEYNLEKKDPCLWLNANDECVVTDIPRTATRFGHVIKSESLEYDYIVFVNYVFNYQSTEDQSENYPAKVWVEFSKDGSTYSTESFIANNSKHLRFLVSFLANDVKNTIDSRNGATSTIHDNSELYIDSNVELGLIQESDFEQSIMDRVKGAFSTAGENWTTGVWETANEVNDDLSIAISSDASKLVRAENTTRAIYHLGLGTLKAVFSVGEGLVQGGFTEEVKKANEIINTYAAIGFNQLSEENQEVVLNSVSTVNAYLDKNEEARALVEASLFYVGSKFNTKKTGCKQYTNINEFGAHKSSSSNGCSLKHYIKRQTDLNKKGVIPSVTTFLALKNFYPAPYKLRINRLYFYSYGLSYKLGMKYKKDLEKVKSGNDPKGKLSEKIANSVFADLLTKDGYKKVDGTYYGDNNKEGQHGFDGVFVKVVNDEVKDIIIIESKQLKNMAATLNKGDGINPDQMSDAWVAKVAQELVERGGDKALLGGDILTNRTLVKKYVTGVNRRDESLEVIKIK